MKETSTETPQRRSTRLLGFRDLVLFYVVTGVSLRWIALAASIGPSSLLVWAAACLLFYVPLVLAVSELTSRFPSEGGLYVWTTKAFGQLPGFVVGWMYWTSNLPYFSGVLYFAAGNVLFLHRSWEGWSHTAGYFVVFSVITLMLITALNIAGLNLAKWMYDAGALAMWIPALILTTMGLVALWRFGSATSFSLHTLKVSTNLKSLALCSGIVFAFGGCETASLFADEIQQPEKIIPRALFVAGLTITLCYVAGTISVLLILPSSQLSSLDGLVQTIQLSSERLGVGGVTQVFALLVAISNVAAAAAYHAAASRLPFVAGLDGLLPRSLAKVHPRSGAPYVSLVAQALIAICFALLGQAGTSVKGAYEVLVDISVITYLIPYLFVFAALIKLQKTRLRGPEFRIFGGRLATYLIATSGILATSAAIFAACIPAADEPHRCFAFFKITGSTAALIGLGLAVYWAGRKRPPA